MNDLINKQQTIDEVQRIGRIATLVDGDSVIRVSAVDYVLHNMPPAQPEYKPVTAEDFAKVMSENTVYQYMAWYGMYLALMKEQGFVICKKM